MGIQYLEEARSASAVNFKGIKQNTKLHAAGFSAQFLQTSSQ